MIHNCPPVAEFGIFDDCGLFEGGFASFSAAETAVRMEPGFYGDRVNVHELCPEHRDQARVSCDCHRQEDETQAVDEPA